MNHRVTAALVLLVLLAAGYMLWERPPKSGTPLFPGSSETPVQPQVGPPLVDFDPAAIVSISIARPNLELQLRRRDNTWTNVRSPEGIDDFLDNLRQLRQILTLPASAKQLSACGLKPPSATITLAQRAAAPLIIELGGPSPASTGAYTRINRVGPIILTGALLRWEFDRLITAATGGGNAVKARTRSVGRPTAGAVAAVTPGWSNSQ